MIRISSPGLKASERSTAFAAEVAFNGGTSQGPIAAYLGKLASLLGRHDVADAYLRAALETATAFGWEYHRATTLIALAKGKPGEIKEDNGYVNEHRDLICAILNDTPLNEAKQVADSTLTAIMGRMSAYTGKAVTWEKALNSKEDLFPSRLGWDVALETPAVAVPGAEAAEQRSYPVYESCAVPAYG